MTAEVCIGHDFHVLTRDGMVRLRAEGEAPVWLEEVAFNAIQAVRAEMRRSGVPPIPTGTAGGSG